MDIRPPAAREAKRALFLESMQRIGKLPPETFGDLGIVASDLGYRTRNRFHVDGRGAGLVIGQFAGRSHRVVPVTACRAITPQTSELLPAVRDALAACGATLSELATVEVGRELRCPARWEKSPEDRSRSGGGDRRSAGAVLRRVKAWT